MIASNFKGQVIHITLRLQISKEGILANVV